MERIEKTVFISYRRTDVYVALAVYEKLKNQGYDVFFDYTSIPSGDFEQNIISNIKARAHFLIILTPTALDRCNEPGDWLRREIEMAIDEKRNIVPLFFKGFQFGDPSVSNKLTGKLIYLRHYNGMNVYEDYFDAALQKLSNQFLNIPLDTVLHPVSTEVQKVVKEEQVAADKALEQIEDIQELVRHPEETPIVQPAPGPVTAPPESSELEVLKSQAIQFELVGDFWNALQTYYKIKKIEPLFPSIDWKIRQLERELHPIQDVVKERTEAARPIARSIPWRLVAGIAGGLVLITLLIWGGINIWNNLPTTTATTTEPTGNSHPASTQKPQSSKTSTPAPTKTSLPPTPTPGMGSTRTSAKDNMKLVFVPAGEFTMGSDTYISNINADERPMHKVTLSSYWIDQTEVTNQMYAMCVNAGSCQPLSYTGSSTHNEYYGTIEFADYPVLIGYDWNRAKVYCEWAGRRLPTEAEWEKAARSTDARIYPWGNNKPNSSLANYNSNIGDTTKVGNYPAGVSIYGALDMAGNVWEWVSSVYKPYPYSPTDGRENLNVDGARVLRGGSWIDSSSDVRSGVRPFGLPPIDNSLTIGFRCAMSETP